MEKVRTINSPQSRRVRLFKNGSNQAVRIPREFELPGNDVVMVKEGNRLIIEAIQPASLKALLAGWEPLDEGLPTIADQIAAPLEL